MNQDYWNRLARIFDEEVFDPVASDRQGIILETLSGLSTKTKEAVDIGCGTGRNIPLLARKFRSVIGIDISNKCLEIAERSHGSLGNVKFRQLDLAKDLPGHLRADVGLCLNVVMMPSYETRRRVLNNILSLVRPGGHLLLLVPSLESALLTINRLIRWNLDEYASYRQAAAAANEELGFSTPSIRDGLIYKGGTLTKHYLREELLLNFEELGQEVLNIHKVEYNWDTEFDSPPSSMSAPYPWDWLVHIKLR